MQSDFRQPPDHDLSNATLYSSEYHGLWHDEFAYQHDHGEHDVENGHEMQTFQPLMQTPLGPRRKTPDVTNTSIRSSIQGGVNKLPHQRATARFWKGWLDVANRWWMFELLACLVSLSCFAALVGVLVRSNDREQTKWFYGRLTLNGLLALLSTFMRASMMVSVAAALSQLKWNWFITKDNTARNLRDFGVFDQASRGPWGSVVLLFSRFRVHLALLGAVITIFSLALDLFSQQIIVTRYQSVPQVNITAASSIPRSETYSIFAKADLEVSYSLDLPSRIAIYDGIMNAEVVPPSAQCSTGQCSWPIIPSLAICGGCTDVTTNVWYNCTNVSNPTTGSYQNCTYHLTDAHGLDAEVIWALEGNGSGISIGDTPAFRSSYFANPQYNESDLLYTSNFYMADASKTHVPSVQVHGCALWFCVQAYNITVDNGTQLQEIVGNWSRTLPFNFSTGYLNFTEIPASFNIPPDTDFAVSVPAFSGYEQNGIGTQTVTFGTDSPSFYTYSSDVAEKMLEIDDYDAWVDQFALSMANNIRRTGAAVTSSSHWAGLTYFSQARVAVRWGWLLFPACMVVASIVFLLASIWQTRRRHVPVWKSDALALIHCDLDMGAQSPGDEGRHPLDEQFVLECSNDRGTLRRATGLSSSSRLVLSESA